MSQKWTCGQDDQFHPPPNPTTVFHCLPPNCASSSCTALLVLSVCGHALHTCCVHVHIHCCTSILSVPSKMPGQTMSNGCPQILYRAGVHADKCVCVCVCVLGREDGRCRKDTLTNQSLRFSSRLAHGDLDFSRVAVLLQQPSTEPTKHKKMKHADCLIF